MGNSVGIMPLNLPGGSTVQWGARWGLLCLAALVSYEFSALLSLYVDNVTCNSSLGCVVVYNTQ